MILIIGIYSNLDCVSCFWFLVNFLCPESLPAGGQGLAALGTVNLQAGKLHVRNGRVMVRIDLSELSDAVVDKLKELGFEETGRSESDKRLIGWISVKRLEALSVLAEVVRVEPGQ